MRRTRSALRSLLLAASIPGFFTLACNFGQELRDAVLAGGTAFVEQTVFDVLDTWIELGAADQ
jgi:hypothetical protein